MFYGDSIQDTRKIFYESWNKFQQKKPLSPLESEVVEVILAHPEYHKTVEELDYQNPKFYSSDLGEANPFLHMGLHLAVREQIATDRPQGIKDVYNQLLKKYKDSWDVQHLLMEQLAECLWLSQNKSPDEQDYLMKLRNKLY